MEVNPTDFMRCPTFLQFLLLDRFYRSTLLQSVAFAVVILSVLPSVTLMLCVETTEHIAKSFGFSQYRSYTSDRDSYVKSMHQRYFNTRRKKTLRFSTDISPGNTIYT